MLHNKILDNILETTRVSFDDGDGSLGINQGVYPDQGFINAKDFQIQCLFEYEKLKSKPFKKKKHNHPSNIKCTQLSHDTSKSSVGSL